MLKHFSRIGVFIWILFAIEFLDELVFGSREAALPLIRDDFGLTCIQIGLLTTIPALLSILVEPIFGIWADMDRKKLLILGGGVVFSLGLLFVILSSLYVALLMGFIILFPASGAFVNIAQAQLMDSDPERHET